MDEGRMFIMVRGEGTNGRRDEWAKGRRGEGAANYICLKFEERE